MINPRPRSLQTIVVSLIVVGLISLALGGYLSPLSSAVLNPLINAQTWIATRYNAIQSFLASPQDLNQLRQQNSELSDKVARLQAEIIALKQQMGQVRILEALVDFARVQPQNQYVAAKVIGRDVSPFTQYILIDRGSDDGILRGMPVVTEEGLVGRIAAVTGSGARVQLITDVASKVNIILEPSGAQAVLVGSLTGDLSVEMIPPEASVKIGDIALSSGLGGNFPGQIVIGQITNLRSREIDLFQRAALQPVVNFNEIELVLIITNFRSIEIQQLIPTPRAP